MTRLLSALHRLLGADDHGRVSDETLRSIQRDEMRQGWAENHVRWHSPKEIRRMNASARRDTRASVLRVVGRGR